MNQLTIFSELGMINDPVYHLIDNLQIGQSTTINTFDVKRTSLGFFEISNHDYHEFANSKKDCYEKLSAFLVQEKDVLENADAL